MNGKVVNVRNFSFESPTPYIYVGRYMPGKFRGHPLANPFKLTRQGHRDEVKRTECLEKYRAWLLALPNVRELLTALKAQMERTGLPLGCWCHPLPCHADVLIEEMGKL